MGHNRATYHKIELLLDFPATSPWRSSTLVGPHSFAISPATLSFFPVRSARKCGVGETSRASGGPRRSPPPVPKSRTRIPGETDGISLWRSECSIWFLQIVDVFAGYHVYRAFHSGYSLSIVPNCSADVPTAGKNIYL